MDSTIIGHFVYGVSSDVQRSECEVTMLNIVSNGTLLVDANICIVGLIVDLFFSNKFTVEYDVVLNNI